MQAWDILLNGTIIDWAFYAIELPADRVKATLVTRFKYNPNIEVRQKTH